MSGERFVNPHEATAPRLDFEADGAAAFGPGETRDVEVRASEALPYNALVIDTYEGFTVCGFTVGGKSQLVVDPREDPSGELPALFFKDSLGIRLALDPVEIDTPIVLRMRNDQEGPHPFKARLMMLPLR